MEVKRRVGKTIEHKVEGRWNGKFILSVTSFTLHFFCLGGGLGENKGKIIKDQAQDKVAWPRLNKHLQKKQNQLKKV